MCGIAGIIGVKENKQTLESMIHSIKHRGPDDSGIFSEAGIGLGHRRLSIIDLSKSGRNPMFNSDGSLVIVYNGEVFNYLEIKNEIGSRYNFQTDTDTEVVLAAYQIWGKECLQKFIGMYSFSIWNKKKRKLFAARDRLGIKPFYYYKNKKKFIFASEIKSLLCNDIPREPNNKVVFQYLFQGLYDHSEETFYKSIKQLLPGHFLEYEDGKLIIESYWDLSSFEANENPDKNEAIQKTLEILTDSVKLAMRSDVPVGVNLSGGLDSSCLLDIVDKNWNNAYSLEGFNQDYEDEAYSEKFWVNKMADRTGRKVNFSVMSPEMFFEIDDFILSHQDEPYAGVPVAGYAGMYQESQKRGTKVLLDGNGLDEAFAGYKSYHNIFLSSLLKNRDSQFDYYSDLYKSEWGESHEPLKSMFDEESGREGLGHDGTLSVNRNWISKDFAEENQDFIYRFKQHCNSSLKEAMCRDICIKKIPRSLRFNDRISMAFSRELRVPFLDHRILEYTFSLSDKTLFTNGRPKGLVRRAFNHLPQDVVHASKRNIQTPQSIWLNEDLRENILLIFKSEIFQNLPYFDGKRVVEDYESLSKNKLANSFYIWQALSMYKWSCRLSKDWS